jgi:hypothetical protein
MRPLRLLLLPSLAFAAACGDAFPLPKAGSDNVVDTVSLYALSGTAPRQPSAYWLGNYVTPARPILIQDGAPFDFAIDLDSAYQAVLKPTGALRLGRSSGVMTTTLPFDSIRIAPGAGFQLDSAVTVPIGGRAIVHSRQTTCDTGIPAVYYAKLEILTVDTATRRIDFQILVDNNCGYRGLELGRPRR